MEFMSTLNEIANSCAPPKEDTKLDSKLDSSTTSQPVPDTSIPAPAKVEADSESTQKILPPTSSTSNALESKDTSKSLPEESQPIDTAQEVSNEEVSNTGETFKTAAAPEVDGEPITNEPIASEPISPKRNSKKRARKKNTEDSKKTIPLQTIEEIENLTVYQKITRVSAKTAKCSLFTTIWVLKDKLDGLKELYPKDANIYILDDLITDHLIQNKVKLKAAADKNVKKYS